VRGEPWIVDGNCAAMMEIRLNAGDPILFLDTATFRRIARIVGRRFARRGPARPDVIGAERLNWKFLRYVATYNRARRPQLLRALAAHADHTAVHVLRSDADVRAFLDGARQLPSAASRRESSRRGHSASSE
jgi:hypothetical protein